MKVLDRPRRDGGTTAISIAWEEWEHVEGLHRVVESTPERRLLVAVLENGLRDLRPPGSGLHAETIAKEAWDWLWSESVTWPMDFVRICEALGLCPGDIRRCVVRAMPRRLRRSLHEVHRFGTQVRQYDFTQRKRGKPRTLRRTWR